ncbi:MAG TPA: ATP-binding protein [Saprospiraceae bacterium]|nr:ATP-binding protein [Saprospiraceae bacterium]
MLDLILPKSSNIETSANYILQKVIGIFKPDYGFISIFKRNSVYLHNNPIFLYNLKISNIPKIHLGENGLISKAIKSKKTTFLANNITKHVQYIDCNKTKDEIVFPLIHQNEVFGVLVLSSNKINYFKNDDIINLSIISSIISHILYDKIQHLALLELAKPINFEDGSIKIFDLLAKKVRNIGDFPIVCVWILNNDAKDEYIELKGKSGVSDNDYQSDIIYKSEGGHTWKALENNINNKLAGDITICYDLLSSQSLYLHKQFVIKNNLISVISIPINYKEDNYGIINAYSKNIIKFNEDEILVLKNIALSAGVEINNFILRNRESELRHLLLDQAHFTNAGMVTLSLAHDVQHKLVDLKLNLGSITNSIDQVNHVQSNKILIGESKSLLNTLSNLFERLLSYNSQKASNYKENNLSDILENIRLMFSSSLGSIKLEINCNKSYVVYCDFNQLSQVFVNLLKNSIYSLKETTHRHPYIQINVEDVGGGYILIKFYDNGEGIKESELEKIFDITYSTKGIDGSGFGLAICQNIIVDILGGTIKVRSAFGSYTEFIIKLLKHKKVLNEGSRKKRGETPKSPMG